MAGNFADSNERLNILLNGPDRETIQRQRTTAGKPSGPTEKEHFNFFAATTNISGVTMNIGMLINPVGTSKAAISVFWGELQLFAKTSAKCLAKSSQHSVADVATASLKYTFGGTAELFLFEFTNRQKLHGFLRKLF